MQKYVCIIGNGKNIPPILLPQLTEVLRNIIHQQKIFKVICFDLAEYDAVSTAVNHLPYLRQIQITLHRSLETTSPSETDIPLELLIYNSDACIFYYERFCEIAPIFQYAFKIHKPTFHICENKFEL